MLLTCTFYIKINNINILIFKKSREAKKFSIIAFTKVIIWINFKTN
jgi:hypothetical protein